MSANLNAPSVPAPSATPTPAAPAAQVQEAPASQNAAQASNEGADAASKEVAAAISSKNPEKALESLKKKFKVRVDSKDEEIELDLGNEEEVKKHLQMSKAAQKRMHEMAEYKKSLNQFFEKLQKDPLSVISDPRLKIPEDVRRKMAEAIINNEVQEMQKSPEVREKERLQKELEALKKQHEDDRKVREEAEFRRIQEQAAVQYDRDITDAIAKAGLPKTAYTVKQMAETLMFCLENNLDLSAADVVPYIKKKTLSDFREMVSSLPDEEFESFLGKDNIGRIRKRNLAKLKGAANGVPTAESIKSTGASSGSKEEKPKDKIPMKALFSKW